MDSLGILDADVRGSDDLEDEPVVVLLTHCVGDGRDVGFLQERGQWSVPCTQPVVQTSTTAPSLALDPTFQWKLFLQDLRLCSTVSSFKARLKTFLLSQYFRSN